MEDSPYEPVNSRLSDIFRLAPILGKDKNKILFCGGFHSISFYLCFSLFHWLPVSLERRLKLQAVHALTEGYPCVKYLSPLILSATCLSLPSYSPQKYCMLAGPDLAWGAIVLSLIEQMMKKQQLSVVFWCFLGLLFRTASSCGCLNPLVEKSE